jgi:hypothetical protein
VSNSVPVDSVGHDVVEIFGSDESVFVEVGLAEHVLVFLLSQVLSEILADLLELEGGELALNYAIVTDRLGSKALKTLLISARVSFSPILAVARRRNSAKSIPPDWSSSSSARIW